MNNKILKTYIQIITFFAYLLIIFGLCRIGFIINSGILNSAITGAYGSNSLPVSDIGQTLFAGFRYDGRLAAPAAFIFAALYIVSKNTCYYYIYINNLIYYYNCILGK